MDMRDGDLRSPGYGRKRDDPFVLSGLSEHLQRQEADPVSVKPKGSVRYRECLRNHAANVGGNVVDGCGEFMPTGEEGTLEALRCAACECHRNFHRKEVEGETQFSSSCRRLQLTMPSHQLVAPMNVAYCGGTESSSEELNAYVAVKKRSRTKFTAEQKSRMVEFAERVGWRFQRQDEEEIDRFCGEVGVKRQVLKVWMHNNKNAIKNQQPSPSPPLLNPQPQPPTTTPPFLN